MRQCNECKNFSCSRIRKARKGAKYFTGKINMSVGELQSECDAYIRPVRFKMPLIALAMTTNPQGVADVLEAAGATIKELDRKPGFKLVYRR